ncbi:uncharacterized protein DEA37_0010328 [Paragonimus westermani]|uniref:Prenyltransferase alpha-alpha toroid domain-containing protein n=1 Tax=Paragonimus westermani TaxID=34504 RepID=A0A5J4N8W9_9TREM|nr:uncharacterized protein DEA37_0010328 [Paragonimus westermani]
MENPHVSRKLAEYLKRMTGLLPESMSSLEHTRLIVLFFSVIGTDLLCETHGVAADELIDWVYSHQIATVSSLLASNILDLKFQTQSILAVDFGVFCTWMLQSVRIKLV